MNKVRMAIFLSATLLLGACGNANDEKDEKEIGFTLTGETIEEATNVPEDEKTKIKALLDENIATFNDKDIEAYMNTLSEDTESFNLEEERVYMNEIFSQYGVDRKIFDVTITKYSDSEANVVATLVTVLKELSSEEEVTLNGRQATVLTKENGEWKIASVHYVGNEGPQ